MADWRIGVGQAVYRPSRQAPPVAGGRGGSDGPAHPHTKTKHSASLSKTDKAIFNMVYDINAWCVIL